MFKTTFNTEFGKIEVMRTNAIKPGASWEGVAYFFGMDYETEIDSSGYFQGYFGDVYKVSYQTIRGVTTASLARAQPVEIGIANVLPNTD